MKPVRKHILAMLAVALLAGTASATDLRKSNLDAASVGEAPSVPPAAAADRAAVGSAAQPRYSEILARPLFSPSRRPAKDESRIAGTTAPLPVLRGIAIVDDHRVALVESGASGSSRSVFEHQRVDAGVIERILPDRIVIGTPDGATATVLLNPAQPSGRAAQTNADEGHVPPAYGQAHGEEAFPAPPNHK